MRRAALSIALLLTACVDPPAPSPTPAASPGAAQTPAAATKAPAKVAPSTDTKSASKGVEIAHTFEAQLAAIDRAIAGYTQVAERNGRSSSAFGRVAQLYLGRARLSGSYDDYAKAEQFVAKGFEVGPSEGFGPFMVRARLNYTLHRLDRVNEDYAQAIKLPAKDARTRNTRALFAANLAFQRGEYEAAKNAMDVIVADDPNLSALSSLGLYHWKAGQFDEAEALYVRALEAHEGRDTEPLAWVHLQRGLMDLDRGRYDDALAHYRDGEALIAGYWLIDEHIAEILTLQGKTEQAMALYLDIIERTQNPEFMDAVAELHLAAGKPELAQPWIDRANARFGEQLERFPEAAYGHALEHFLAFGKDPAATLKMALNNHAIRPNATAKRLLAEAHLAAKQVPEAQTMIEQALATPMRSADLHLTAAAVYEAAGNAAKAEAQRKLARAIHPEAGD
ncbi:MAG: tetratricopeptide repeat protein [Deltaproteobacteria bacterium]|nr:tetratricopeptide repeat protein [Deltaproteobacteria bacterium]